MANHSFGGVDGTDFGYALFTAYYSWKITNPETGLWEGVTEELAAELELPVDVIHETLTDYYTVYGNRVSTHYSGCYEKHPLCLTRLLLDNAPDKESYDG